MNIKTLALLLLALCAQPVWSQTPAASPAAVDSPALTTRLAERDLWVEHIFWIRNYALANQSADKKQAKVAADQVVDNATKIANSIAPLYGQPAADQLLKLLAGHWGAVKHYSDATVAKDAKGKQVAVTELTSNAKAIAAFLAGANPNLPEATLVNMLSAHGGHHIAQIDEFAAHDYAGEARTWAMMRTHIQALADALTAALVKQFPDKF
jgi:ATP-dependent protease HslVU (ClpYQ) peptidase subunit